MFLLNVIKEKLICRKVDSFKHLVNRFAESMDKGEDYELTCFSDMEFYLKVLSESEEYVSAFVLSDFKESCVFLDGIIKIRLDSKKCTDIERLKLTQIQETLDAFLSCTRLKKLASEAYGKKDFETAFEYYRIAADKGDAEAQYNLGKMYLSGEAVSQDYQEVEKNFFVLVCSRGPFWWLYRYVKDYQEAVRYFHMAADQGYEPAKEALDEIEEHIEAKDYIRKYLKKDDIEVPNDALDCFFEDEDCDWYADDDVSDPEDKQQLISDWDDFWDDDDDD